MVGLDYIDKSGVIPGIHDRGRVILECGAGTNPQVADSIRIDILDMDGVDIVADLNNGFPFLPDECVDEIASVHFLEHLENLEYFMKDAHRILKKGGKFRGGVPHFSNPHYYSDPTHRKFFGLYSFSYFSKSRYFRRIVPNFYNKLDFRIENVRLIFYSDYPIRFFLKKGIQCIFNINRYMQEMYEENFCFLFPAYAIEFELEKQ